MRRADIDEIFSQLTLEEKAGLCSGADFWQTKAVPDKGVPSIWLSDGPHGLRKENPSHKKKQNGNSVKATCFPPAVTLACSWDKDLITQVGGAVARECLANGVSVLLGPGVNIKRNALCGRNFEYYSEDPFLTGWLATSMINGIQREGVGACIKHFAVNSQEYKRMSISSELDERALHEIYLQAFFIAIQHAHPAAIMCSYNKINGVYASENEELLNNILRRKWGYDGLVMSDWGAVNDRAKGIKAGLDLEMPASGGINDRAIINAVHDGGLSLDSLDSAAYRVLSLAIDGETHKNKNASFVQKSHHKLAIDALTRSAVLLKNDGILPLSPTDDIVVIGSMAQSPRIQGGGSSAVNRFEIDSFISVMPHVPYSIGYYLHEDTVDDMLVSKAVALAKNHAKIVIFLGLTDIYECEGYDRDNLHLPANQLDLLAKLSRVNSNIVVVLAGGGAVETSWIDNTRALLYTGLGGEGVGEGTRRLLYGEICPSGKLAETWVLQAKDMPSATHYPMGPQYVSYNESIYVGYRYYDKANKYVQFPFGYGLSYTDFYYDALSLSAQRLAKGTELLVNFSITNTGAYNADEIAEIYISHKNSAAYQPIKTLAGFARTYIQSGDTKTVQVQIPYSTFAYYSVEKHDFVVESGECEILCGAHSRELPLTAIIYVEGEDVHLPLSHSAKGPYGDIHDNSFGDEAFYSIHSRTKMSNTNKRKGEYTGDTTLGEMSDSFTARRIKSLVHFIASKALHYSHNSIVNARVSTRSADDLPFKNLAINSHGLLSHEASSCLLDICNGTGSYFSLIREILFKPQGKKE